MLPPPPFRIGQGYDIHPLIVGRTCILGGVKIPSELGPDGHSDADVLLHALADAILGAAGLRDIGHYFPNTDATLRGLNSGVIVKKAVSEILSMGWRIGNVDIVVLAEQPKISPHISDIKKSVAQLLGVEVGQVGIKATTNEGMDAIGQGKALAVQAVCLIYRG